MFPTSFIVVDPLSSLDSNEDLRHMLAFLKQNGYDGIEFDLGGTSPAILDRVDELVTDLELTIPSLMTGGAYADGLCLSSPQVSVRKATVARLVSYFKTARRFSAVLVVGLLQGLRSDEPDPTLASDRIVGCFRELAPAAEEQGVQLVIEPVNHLQVGFNNSVAEVRATIDRIGSPAIKPMVDTPHMNIEEHLPVQCVLDLSGDLRHVHLSESNGGIFGTGPADLEGVLQALRSINYRHFVSVKIYRATSWQQAAQTAKAYLDNSESRTS
jgi:sugar phosphate isomerase/epimerase